MQWHYSWGIHVNWALWWKHLYTSLLVFKSANHVKVWTDSFADVSEETYICKKQTNKHLSHLADLSSSEIPGALFITCNGQRNMTRLIGAARVVNTIYSFTEDKRIVEVWGNGLIWLDRKMKYDYVNICVSMNPRSQTLCQQSSLLRLVI